MKKLFLVVLGMSLFTVVSCSLISPKPASLYARLGGQPALVAVVDDFVERVAADSRINDFFEGIDIPQFKSHLVDQICAGTGGPCKYSGRDMKAAHDEFSIKEAHFSALVEDLVVTLNHFKVPDAEQQELLSVLGPMKKDIVNTP